MSRTWTVRRPWRRLFSLPAALLLAVSAGQAAPPAGPARTTVSDVVYRADGSLAAGTLLISWPAF
ncbi:MAG TPA: hypothetical protein VE825_11705, partial [Terriglobales bacterium]|nr:hypothetical protein [Terriglobales bacterium]